MAGCVSGLRVVEEEVSATLPLHPLCHPEGHEEADQSTAGYKVYVRNSASKYRSAKYLHLIHGSLKTCDKFSFGIPNTVFLCISSEMEVCWTSVSCDLSVL